MKLELDSLVKAITALDRSVTEVNARMGTLSPILQDTVRAGIIQNFEVTYEQSWKMMKRWLETNVSADMVDGVTRRELFRQAAEARLITNVDLWMEFHAARNETAHTYDAGTAGQVFSEAGRFLTEAKKFLETIKARND